MLHKPSNPGRHGIAWGMATAFLVVVALFSLSVPAMAQSQPPSMDQQSVEAARYLEILSNTFKFIQQNYVDPVTAKKLYEGAMKGMLDSLGDPYTVFLDESMMNRMTDMTSGEFGGVGLYISKQLKDPKLADDQPLYIEVSQAMEGTPGWRAGLRTGDLITKIDGETTAPLTIDEAQGKIRGKEGTPVKLGIHRDGQSDFEVSIVRAKIEIPTVKRALIPTAAGNVAYLRILEFSGTTKSAVDEALRYFGAAGYKSMVIDLRGDPGGLLDSVIQIADQFLDSGIIVSTKGPNPYLNSVSRAKPSVAVPMSLPVVVLIDKGSASASEILAGALKDNKRAYLVGENSYGKGSVQQIYPIDSTGFKMTMARYYTPSDENIDKTGIPPDLVSKEPDLTQAETDILGKLLDSGKVTAFAKTNPKASVADQNSFALSLAKDFPLSERLLKRLVRNEFARKMDIPPVYDLEFDTALNDALQVLGRPDFAQMLAQAKSVKELVEAKKAAAAAAPAKP